MFDFVMVGVLIGGLLWIIDYKRDAYEKHLKNNKIYSMEQARKLRKENEKLETKLAEIDPDYKLELEKKKAAKEASVKQNTAQKKKRKRVRSDSYFISLSQEETDRPKTELKKLPKIKLKDGRYGSEFILSPIKQHDIGVLMLNCVSENDVEIVKAELRMDPKPKKLVQMYYHERIVPGNARPDKVHINWSAKFGRYKPTGLRLMAITEQNPGNMKCYILNNKKLLETIEAEERYSYSIWVEQDGPKNESHELLDENIETKELGDGIYGSTLTLQAPDEFYNVHMGLNCTTENGNDIVDVEIDMKDKPSSLTKMLIEPVIADSDKPVKTRVTWSAEFKKKRPKEFKLQIITDGDPGSMKCYYGEVGT